MASKKRIKSEKTKTFLKEPIEKTLPGLERLLQLGLLFIVLLSPYYRGLYFDYERAPFFFIIFLLSAIFFIYQIFYQHKKISLNSPVELFFLLFVLLYGLSIFWAADKGLAFREFFSYLSFFFFFMIMTFLPKDVRMKRIYFFGFGLNAVLLTLLGYFYQFHWIDTQKRVLGMSMRELFSNRLQSTLQYPNTFAAYIGLGIIALLFLYLLEEKPFIRYLSIISLFTLGTGFYFTYSRGGIIVVLLSILYLLILLPKIEKKKIIYLMSLFIIIFLIFIQRLEYALFNGFSGQFFILLILMTIIPSTILAFVPFKWEKSQNLFKKSKIYLGIVLILLIIGLTVIILNPNRLNIQLSSRFRQISLNTIISQERWIFYHDAFRIALARPFFGWGGVGWNARYLAFQSYRYFSKDPHNYYLQILIEAGFPGLILMGGVIFLLLYGGLKILLKKNLNNENNIMISILSGLIFLSFAHCMIDVDFSLGAYQLSAWMFASIMGYQIRTFQGDILPPHFRPIPIRSEIGLAVTIFGIIISLFIVSGNQKQLFAEAYQSQGKLNLALQRYQEAVSVIPFNAEGQYSLSRIYQQLYNQQKRIGYLDRSVTHGEQALKISPVNYLYLRNMAIILAEKGQFEASMNYLTDAILQAPYIMSTYEESMAICQKIANYYLSKNQKNQAITYLEKALSFDRLFDQFSSKSLFPIQKSDGLIKLSQKIITQLLDLRK